MKKLFSVLFLLVILSPSAFAFGAKNTMDNLMSGWVGENINTVIDTWGYPDDVKEIAGRTVYYWDYKKERLDYFYGSGFMYIDTLRCTKMFETDKNSIIIKWQWKGNSCPATYRGVRKLVNPQNDYREQEKELKKKRKGTCL